MTFDHIDYEERDGIAEITLRRPEKRNALTNGMFRDLRTCWERFDEGDARIAILKSCDDKVFSAGADLTDPPSYFSEAIPEFGFRTDKPIIAATSGKVIGAGLTLVLMCDFIVASETTEFIYPEAKVGVAKGMISAAVRRGPVRVVLEMILSGDPLSAQRAYETGMINKIVAEGDHVEAARAFAGRISGNAPLVVEMLKRMSLEALGNVPIQQYSETRSRLDVVANSQDARDALEAFRAKRKPIFNRR